MTDLRKAAEMALEALDGLSEPYDVLKAQEALRQALAQPEQIKRVCNTCNGTGIVKDLHNFATGGKREQPCWNCHEMADEEKWSTLGDADHRLLLGKSNNFTKETENRLCDIERRLAAIETQPALAQGEQEPVAWMTNSEQDTTAEYMFCHVQTPMHDIPLYEAPPSKPWVSLTDEDLEGTDIKFKFFAYAVEDILKEKNT